MSLMYRKILDRVTLSPGTASDLSGALDLGEFGQVHFVLTVHSAGDGDAPKLCVKHAAVNEEGAYVDFAVACETTLASTGTSWFQVDAFTRYVCWFISGTLNSEATVSLDLVAKR